MADSQLDYLSQVSVADLDRAVGDLAGKVLPHFGGGLEPVQADPREDLADWDDQRAEQTVTLLQLLGYLREPTAAEVAARRCVWSSAEITIAWSDWRQDRLALERAGDPDLTIKTERPPSSPLTDDALRRDLKACASLEGEVTLAHWPAPDAVTLASRILTMRLRLYGLSDNSAGAGLAADSEARFLHQAGRITAKIPLLSAVEMINQLGDIENLTKTMQGHLSGGFIVLYRPKDRPFPPEEADETPLLTPTAGIVNILDLNDAAAADWNNFAIRLLQVRLWMLGYYRGEVDGRWGVLSARGLNAYFRDYRVEHPSRLWGRIRDDRVVLDIIQVLSDFATMVDGPVASLERRDIDDILAQPEVVQDAGFWGQLASAQATYAASGGTTRPRAAYAGLNFEVAGSDNLLRKRYFGWRGIFASFKQFIHDVITSLKDRVIAFLKGIAEAISKGLGFVRNIIRYIVDSSRSAVRIVTLGVQRLRAWLTTTPVATGTAEKPVEVLTVWQHDFDTVQFVQKDCPADLVAKHSQTLDWMRRSLDVMLEIGIQLLRLVLTIGNWLMFAWQALQTVRKIITELQDPLLEEILADTAAT